MNINSVMGNSAYASMQKITAPAESNAGQAPRQNQTTAPLGQSQAGQNQQAFQVSITPEARAILAADTTSQQPPPPPPPADTQSQEPRAMIDVVG
ncbi:MAG: hypothetical protein V1793_12765 [Pseudomonadota bacterium]